MSQAVKISVAEVITTVANHPAVRLILRREHSRL